MKQLTAVKAKDGWLVTIKDYHVVYSKDEVLKLAREHGLKVKETSDENRMFAE